MSRRSTVVLLTLVLATASVSGLLMAASGTSSASPSGRSIPVVPLMRHAVPIGVERALSTDVPIDPSAWSAIVIHHSASPAESPDSLDAMHRSMGLAGLGYHFLIGNGVRMGDGELHVGRRWLEQLPGAHVMGPAGADLNRVSIGICLVGDGDRRPFTDAQLRTLFALVSILRERAGIPADGVMLHADVATTSSPGRYFPASALAERLASR